MGKMKGIGNRENPIWTLDLFDGIAIAFSLGYTNQSNELRIPLNPIKLSSVFNFVFVSSQLMKLK